MRRFALLVLFAAGGADALTLYKCVDARGVTHYTEQPIPGCKGRELDIQPVPAPSGVERPEARGLEEQEREMRRRQVERGQALEKELAERKQREQRCLALRSEHARIATGRRIAQVDAKGERSFMDDDVRQARIAQLQDEISKVCR